MCSTGMRVRIWSQPDSTSFNRKGTRPPARNLSPMRIDEILEEQRPVFSFEFFPPKTEEGERNLWSALEDLKREEPAFVSVTYGAGGSTRDRTIGIVKRIKSQIGLEAMAHFTCVGATVEELRGTLDEMRA